MPKLKNYGKGKRFNVWIPERQLKLWSEIENHSKFVQIALDQAVGVMTWGLLKDKRPDLYYETRKTEEVIEPYNKAFPVDPLTQKRVENARTERADTDDSPQPHTELW